jgi:signal transduction histidine kinase
MSLKVTERIGLTFSLKLSILYALFFIVSSFSLFVVAYFFIDYLLETGERELIEARMQDYRAWYADGGLDSLKARFDEQSETDKAAFFVRIIGPYNKAFFVSIPRGAKGFDPAQLDRIKPKGPGTWYTIKDFGKHNIWTIGSISLRSDLVLQVGKSSTQIWDLLSYFRSVFIRFIVPILLLGVAGGGILTFRAMRPLRNLIQTVRNILDTGEMSTRVPVGSGRGELHQLVTLFNKMLGKNEALIGAMHNSLDNVAHDLRTPMTRMRGVAEFALQGQQNLEACREALADCLEESDRVLTMLNALMDVAEAETGAMRLEMAEVSIPELIQSVVDLYEVIADEKHISITLDLPGELLVRADYARIQQVIANLLDNALKYSEDSGQVTITARRENGSAVITVADTGIGIPAHEIEKIWDRLYRGDRSRSQRGLGLGLSFVRAIVQAHGGTVHVQSEMNKGSTFTVMLPAEA